MNDILRVLLSRIIELEQQKNQYISEENTSNSENNVNLAQFIGNNVDKELKRQIFKSRIAIIFRKLRLFYFEKRLYITIKDYSIGIMFNIQDLPSEYADEMDEALEYIFARANPTTKYGTPILTHEKAVNAIGKLIDEYLYTKMKHEIIYLI